MNNNRNEKAVFDNPNPEGPYCPKMVMTLFYKIPPNPWSPPAPPKAGKLTFPLHTGGFAWEKKGGIKPLFGKEG